MTHILIVEGNSESLVSVTSTGQIRGAAERYADALTPLAERAYILGHPPAF